MKRAIAISVSSFLLVGLAILSGCASNYYVNGLIHKDRHEYKKALQQFKRVNKTHPIYPRAEKEIDEVSSKIKAIKEAIEKGEQAFSKRKWQSAKRQFQLVLKIQPINQKAKARLEQIEELLRPRLSRKESLKEIENLFKQRKLYLAQKRARSFLRKNPRDRKVKALLNKISTEIKGAEAKVVLHLTQGERFKQEGDFLNAYLEWQEANETLPEDGKAQENLKEIEKEIEPAIRENLKTARQYYAENKFEQVERLLEMNLRARPDDKPSQKLLLKTISELALRYYDQNDYQQAISYWEEALRYDPDNQSIQKYIERARSLQRELEKIK